MGGGQSRGTGAGEGARQEGGQSEHESCTVGRRRVWRGNKGSCHVGRSTGREREGDTAGGGSGVGRAGQTSQTKNERAGYRYNEKYKKKSNNKQKITVTARRGVK